jgi:hypothetical protein
MTSSPDTLVFRFPMPSNLANRASGKSHWRHLHSEKKAYWRTCDTLQAGGILPPPPPLPWAKATIASRMVLGNLMDDSNAMNRHKWVEDWLVTRGYLVDDSRKHLTWAGIPEQRVSRKNEPELEITLTRVDG